LYPEEEEEVEEEEEPQSKITIPKQVTTAPKTTTTPKGESLKAESPKSVKTMNLDELKAYIKSKGLTIKPLPTDTADDLRSLIEREEYLQMASRESEKETTQSSTEN